MSKPVQRVTTEKPDQVASMVKVMNSSGWRCLSITYIENNKVLCLWEQ